ncbi:MAG: permease-like cell division protein FtsX [Pseudomonadota bacterium]
MSTLNESVRRSNPIGAWFLRHAQVSIETLGRLARTPIATLLTGLVIAITLALPALGHLTVQNALTLTGGWQEAIDFSVFFTTDTDEAAAQQLATIIEQRADVAAVRFVSAAEAAAGFGDDAGFAAALESLGENPLPHAVVVRPTAGASTAVIDALRADLASLPEADIVQLDTAWVQRFHALLNLAQRAVGLLAIFFSIAIIVVIGNTIRLDIENRRDEIVVVKLVGGSNGFIRRPFLYSGFLVGLLGGLLAIALVWLALTLMDAPVQRLAGLYGGGFALRGLSLAETAIVGSAGAVLGWLGSFVATARHLRQIEPR